MTFLEVCTVIAPYAVGFGLLIGMLLLTMIPEVHRHG